MKTITYDETQWVLVPKEPTLDMIEAGTAHLTCSSDDVYWSMLSAAPEHPATNEAAAVDVEKMKKDAWEAIGSPSFAQSIVGGTIDHIAARYDITEKT